MLVANNAYELDLFTLGERAKLDEGLLHLYAADGWQPESWIERMGTELEIAIEDSQVAAAADGEPLVLEPPLRFEILPRALRLLVPPAADDVRV
jgi:diacylglycerol kinase family enzyme